MRMRWWPGIALLALLWAAASISGARGQTSPSDEYTAQRAKALDLMKQGKELDALPILEDLHLKNPNDIVVLENLTNSLLHRAAILTDPEESGKIRVRAKEMIDEAIQLGDHNIQIGNRNGIIVGEQDSGLMAVRPRKSRFGQYRPRQQQPHQHKEHSPHENSPHSQTFRPFIAHS